MICQVGGRPNRLPGFRITDPDRHREAALLGPPAIGNRPRFFIEGELQHRKTRAAEVLVENRREILPELRVEEPDDILGHDD